MAYGIDLWKIVLESDCSEETENKIRIGLDDLNAKAKAFDRIKKIHDKNVNAMSISDTECIEMIGNELERAADEI